jgi:O-antigen/teichoic acid export membrane protein
MSERTDGTIRKSLAWSYANWGMSILTPLVMVPLYVRFLGPQQYGAWIVIMSVSSYLSLAELGSWQAIGNRIVEANVRGNRAEVASLVSTGFLAYSAVMALALAVLFAAMPLVWGKLASQAGAATFVAFAVFIALSAAAFPFKAHLMMLRSLQRVDLEQRIGVAFNLGRSVVIAIALVLGGRLLAVAGVHGAATVLAGLTAYFIASRLDDGGRISGRLFRFPLLRQLVKPSFAFLGLRIASTLAFGTDNLVIGYALGGAAVTSYAVPFRLTMVASGVFAAGLSALWPTITGYYAHRGYDALRKGFTLAVRAGLLFAGSAAILLWLAGPAFLRFWAGPGVFPGGATFALQIALMVVQLILTPADAVLMATTRHYGYAAVAVAEGLLNLVLSLWWVHYWGLAGVIAGTVAARIATNGWYLPFAAARTLELPIGDLLRTVAPAAALTAAALAAIALAFGVRAPDVGVKAMLLGLALSAAFGVSFGAVVFTREDREMGFAWFAGRSRAERLA